MDSWAFQRVGDIKKNGSGGVKRVFHDVWAVGLNHVLTATGKDYGVNIYEKDWDVCLILDACRYDLMAEVIGEYGFLSELGQTRSVASESAGWMERTFVDEYKEEMANTAHVTANPHSSDHLDPSDFAVLEEVWQYEWDSDIETIPARVVTDCLISIARESNPEYLIGHYMQPHAAFVPHPDIGECNDEFEESIWRSILRGRISKERVWAAYRDNLRYVLKEIELLRSNIDAEVVAITADHGNAVGEKGIYGHPDVPLDALRVVPWVETSAMDGGGHEPRSYERISGYSVDEQLKGLGYV